MSTHINRKCWSVVTSKNKDLLFISRHYVVCCVDIDGSRTSRVNEVRSAEEKKNFWSPELRVSFPCNLRITYHNKPVWSWCAYLFSLTLTAEVYFIVRGALHLRCMKKELHESSLRKESAIKNCHKFFPKKYALSFKYIKRTEVSWEVWEVHTLWLAVFRSQQDNKNFRPCPRHLYYCTRSN